MKAEANRCRSGEAEGGWCPVEAALAAVLMVLVAVRAMVRFDIWPQWRLTVGADAAEAVNVGVVGTGMVDGLLVVLLAAVVIWRWARRRPVRWPVVGLWAVGTVWVVVHGWEDLENWRVGWSWSAALGGAVAAMMLAESAVVRRMMLAGVVAMAMPMGLEAVHQVAVQHDRDVAHYRQHRREILERQGWDEDSPQLRQFERRLYQREASGRFGLANVFGTVMGCLLMLAVGATVGLWRGGAGRGAVMLGAVMAGGAAAGLVCSFSRGAMASVLVGAVGVAAGACWAWRGSWGRWRRWAVAGMVVMVVAVGPLAVVGRYMVWGVPGEGRGERSLLFRYMYWDAAAAMVGQWPGGVGPGRFQQAFARYKQVYAVRGMAGGRAVCPEDVVDPHNVLVGYVATLGVVGGGAWCVLVLLWVVRAGLGLGTAWGKGAGEDGGKGMEAVEGSAEERRMRAMRRWGLGVVGGWFAGALVLQIPMMVVDYRGWVFFSEYGGMLAAGAAIGGLFVDRWMRSAVDARWVEAGVVGAAAVAAVHGQIEMSMTNVMAGPMLMVLLAVAGAAGRRSRQNEEQAAGWQWPAGVKMAGKAVVTAGVLGAVVVSVIQSVHQVEQQGQFERCRQLYREGRLAWLVESLGHLEQLACRPYDGALYVEAVTMRWMLLEREGREDEGQTVAWLKQVMAVAREKRDVRLWRAMAEMAGRCAGAGEQAAEAMEQWLAGRPYDWQVYWQAAESAWSAGKAGLAGTLYRKALEVEAMAYLDPESRMAPAQRRRAEQRSGGPGGGGQGRLGGDFGRG